MTAVRRLSVLTVLLLAVFVPAELAGACQCIQIDPESKLKTAKAAFVGRVVVKRLVSGGDEIFPVYRYRIRVGRSLKVRLGRRIRLKPDAQQTSCRFEWKKGDLVAAYLHGRRGRWRTNMCLLEDPAVMRELARQQARDSVSRPRPPRSRRSTCR
jgi:hypothetical protein